MSVSQSVSSRRSPRREFTIEKLQRLLPALSALLLWGCGGSDTEMPTTTPVAVRAEASQESPLTEADVRTFLAIVQDLPQGKVPQFQPLAAAAIDDRLPADTLATVYRREYRRMFDPVEQGRHWRRDSQLTSILSGHELTPEEFAALLTRLGCTVAAGTVSSRFDLADAAAKADEQLQEIIARINEWDSGAASGSISAVSAPQHRQSLVDQLKHLVALSEFSRVLLEIPPESLKAVAQHRQALAEHLPQAGNLQLFERNFDGEAVMVPVNFEQTGERD